MPHLREQRTIVLLRAPFFFCNLLYVLQQSVLQQLNRGMKESTEKYEIKSQKISTLSILLILS